MVSVKKIVYHSRNITSRNPTIYMYVHILTPRSVPSYMTRSMYIVPAISYMYMYIMIDPTLTNSPEVSSLLQCLNFKLLSSYHSTAQWNSYFPHALPQVSPTHGAQVEGKAGCLRLPLERL